MRRLFWLVMALAAAPVPGLRAAAPGVPPSKVMEGERIERDRRRTSPRLNYSLEDLKRLTSPPVWGLRTMRTRPDGTIYFATDAEQRRIEQRRAEERRRLEEGAKRLKQMEDQYAQRQAEKGRSGLIALAIVGGILLLRFFIWLARLGQ
jgi:hypothetical protein